MNTVTRSTRASATPAMDLASLARNPVIVAWEVTRACGYRCTHCRADAQPLAAPGQLDEAEARDLIDELATFDGTTLVITGGDPMLRRDLVDITRHATARGLPVALTPSATPQVTEARLGELVDAGLSRIAISLDGATAATHDGMRGIRGSFDRTIRILRMARDMGIPTQVNTTVTRLTAPDLDRIAAIVELVGASMWSVFFLVPVGRGSAADVLGAEETEVVLNRLADLAPTLPYRLKVTEAPSYRRVLAQRGVEPGPPVNAGRGFMFISHDGDVQPSGFLTIPAGNVRHCSPVVLYRGSPLFRALRDPALLTGKCASCRWARACGGSRARALTMTGLLFGDDPTCPHIPEDELC